MNITGMNRFYYLRDFHDMRCKYERVLSVIHQQLNREPEEDEIFIVKRFSPGYRFMRVCKDGEETVYSIQWKDVVVLLHHPVINSLIIK